MKKIIASTIGFFAPMLAFAQVVGTSYVNSVLLLVKGIINAAFPILTSIAILFFFWELIKYIRSSAEEKAENRSMLLYSILALFILFSLWGIIRIIQGVTNTDGNQQIQSSQIPSVII